MGWSSRHSLISGYELDTGHSGELWDVSIRDSGRHAGRSKGTEVGDSDWRGLFILGVLSDIQRFEGLLLLSKENERIV